MSPETAQEHKHPGFEHLVRIRAGDDAFETDVSVIVPTLAGGHRVSACLNSLRAHVKRERLEIVVVDTSEDHAASAVWQQAARVYSLAGATFAEAVNYGAAHARGAILVPLNDDTVSRDDWLTPLLNPRVHGHIVGARLLYPAERPSAESVQHAGVGFDMNGNPYHLWRGAPHDHPEALVPRVVAAVTFACAAVPAWAWKALGGLDTAFKNGYEDIDFCLRARALGLSVVYEPKACLTHLEAQSAGRFAHESANKALFIKRWVASGEIYRNLGMWPFQTGG